MADCIGCGYCCLKAICALGHEYIYKFRKDNINTLSDCKVTRCPLLGWAGDRYVCQLVIDRPDLYNEPLSIGAGCSSSFCNDWREDVRFRG